MSMNSQPMKRPTRAEILAQRAAAQREVRSLLLLCPEKQTLRLQMSRTGVRTPAVVEVLLELSHQQGFQDFERSYELADLAFRVAERISGYDPRIGCHLITYDYRALANAQMANAARIGCWWQQAELLMKMAFKDQLQGTGDPSVLARLGSLRGSLHKDLRRYDLAMEDLEVARDLYQEVGDTTELAKVLVNLSAVYYYLERYDIALAVTNQALDHIDERREPTLTAIACCNRAAFLTALGDPQTAIQSFAVTPPFEELGVPAESTLCAYRSWEIGHAYLAMEQHSRAQECFQQALECFETKEDPYNRGLVLLDIARLRYNSQDTGPAFYEAVGRALALLRQQKLDPQARQAVALLTTAVAEQSLTASMIHRAARTLRAYRPRGASQV